MRKAKGGILLNRRTLIGTGMAALGSISLPGALGAMVAGRYDVRSFGARGDGKTIDTLALQKAIDAAADEGGGTVAFPAGSYLCHSLHLRSRVALAFEPGSVLLAASPSLSTTGNHYDLPEPQPAEIVHYQDYGHNHWHNSLIWGEGLDQVAIVGQGLLWGRGLEKSDGAAEERPGSGNKIIALKNCRNVLIRDLSFRDAGHFGILASGVDNITIDNIAIDTRRDGIDIDSCRNVHISNCTVNSPWDDAIVIKSSYSLGQLRPTEQVTITGCTVTGSYRMGSLLDGTYEPFPAVVPNDPPSHVGRIKIGTETNGDVRNVVVSNCVFEGCCGIAVESEDGAHVEDIRFANITMRNLIGPPFFIRLGNRMRGPAGIAVGAVQRIAFDSIDCWNATSAYCSVISGIPGHRVRDISFRDVRITHQGKGTLRKGEIPEEPAAYPDPQMFGPSPAQGFYLRHVENVSMDGVQIHSLAADPRPVFVLDDVCGALLHGIDADPFAGVEGRSVRDAEITTGRGVVRKIAPYVP